MGSSPHVTSLLLAAALVAALGFACAPTPDPARIGAEAGAGGGVVAPTPSNGEEPLPDAGGGPANGDVNDPFAEGVTYDTIIGFGGTNASHVLAARPDGGAPPAATNPDCLSCHGSATGARPTYATGGLVLASQSGDAGTPCAQCEVLFVDSTGHRVKVTTAVDGTFALLASEYGPVAEGTRVGIRKGALTKAMPSTQALEAPGATLLGCNSASCHLPSGTGSIVLGN